MLSKQLSFVLAIVLCFCAEVWATPLVHDWSKRFGDTDTQYAYGVATDANGNVILTGSFYATVNFGGGVLTSAGNMDVYVAKFDAAGNHLWSKRFGDTTGQYGRSVAVDAMGNVVIAGYFMGTVDFGGGVLTSAGTNDIFVAKLDAAGNHLWSKRFGDGANQMAYGVAVDGSGNVILTGYFAGTVDFGGGGLTNPAPGTWNIFLAKFDGGGVHSWSKHFGDTDSQMGMRVTTDASGNILVTGYFFGGVDFGGGTLTSAGLEDTYVAKFNSAGSHQWSKRFGDSATQMGYGVAADIQGNVVITGYFMGSADFGGGALTSAGNYDVYLAKFDSGGSHLWSKRFGDSSGQYGMNVSCDFLGNVVLTGHFFGTVDFGGGALTVAGNSDFYVARFGPSGSYIWSQRYGGSGSQWCDASTVDNLGNAIVPGYFDGSMDLGGGTLTSAGNNDIFLAKFWRAAPVIHSVRDVPGDQGGLVNLAWDASGCDSPGEHVITKYTLWRAIDAALASEMIAAARPFGTASLHAAAAEEIDEPVIRVETIGATTYYWYQVMSVDAYYLPAYSAPVPTLFDSTGASSEYHYFQVIAHTSTPYVFYTSDPDSGYSVDNLAPAPPLALVGEAIGDDAALTWDRCGGYVKDLSHYAVYRSDVPGFAPGPGNFLDTSPDTTYLDTTTAGQSFHYKVTTLDTHGNESSPSNEVFVEILTGIEDTAAPRVFTVLPNTPNPFAARTTLRFGLAAKSDVTIEVYDVAGRRVFADRLSGVPLGWRSYSFDGRDDEGALLSSGVYFYRVKTAEGTSTKKMVIAR